jgi:Fe2+ transport system protein FeoA
MTTCALCGLAFEPGGSACSERGCPLIGVGCRTVDCPRCGYAVPDEAASRLARWARGLFEARTPAPAASDRTLTDLLPGEEGIVERIEGEPALAARLTAQGIVSGVALHLVQRLPSYVVEVGAMTLALERRVAVAIRMRPGRQGPGTSLAP